MIRIINENLETRCQCGCTLRFNRSDIKKEKHKVFLGKVNEGYERTSEYFREYIECPNCNSILYSDDYSFEEVKD